MDTETWGIKNSIKDRLAIEIKLVEDDATLSLEEKKLHIEALNRAAKDLKQEQMREALRLDKD